MYPNPSHNRFNRFLRHLFSTPWHIGRYFSPTILKEIERAINLSETKHLGEIRFVIEADLNPLEILFNKTPKKRALELFSQLRIWDTEHNNGVLVYICLADRDVEIVADRGIHQRVGDTGWELICQIMEKNFRVGAFETGALQGIALVGEALTQHFPAGVDPKTSRNELPNAPLII